MAEISAKKWRPRLTVEITEEQYNVLKNHIDHGMQRKIFTIIIDDIVAMLNAYGKHFIVALLHKQISYEHFMQSYIKDGEQWRSSKISSE